MTRRGTLSLVCLVGLTLACGGKAKPPPPPPPPPVVKKPPPPPPPPVCVPRYEPALITMANGDPDGGHAQFCVSDDADHHSCFQVDLESGKYETLDASPIPQSASLEPSDVHFETTPTEVKVCAGDACKSLKPKVPKNASEPIVASVAASGLTAVLMLGDGEAGRGVAEVWDVAKAKKLTTIKYAKGDNKCGLAQMIGDTVYISASVCAGPAAHGWLYTIKGKKLAEVGGKDFGTFGTAAVQVADTTWAFLEEGGGTIALQDVKTGKVAKTIDLVSLWSTGGGDGGSPRAGGNPGESTLVRGGDGKLVVIAGSPAAGNLAIVDVASGDVKVISALGCKDAPSETPAPPADETGSTDL